MILGQWSPTSQVGKLPLRHMNLYAEKFNSCYNKVIIIAVTQIFVVQAQEISHFIDNPSK